MPNLPPIPNTPLRDDPTQDSIWKRWLQLLKQDYSGLGTVTSVAVSGADGIGVSGSPITTSGTITLTLGDITPDSVDTAGNLTVDGNTTLGDASGDSLTVNAGTWTYGNNIVATRAIAAAGSATGLTDIITYPSGGSTTIIGKNNALTTSGTSGSTISVSLQAVQTFQSSGTLTRGDGVNIISRTVSPAGAATELNGGRVDIRAASAVTAGNGFIVIAPAISGSGTFGTLNGFKVNNIGNAAVTTAIGVKIDDFTNSTTMRGVQSSLSSGTGKSNIYADGTADNILNGNVRIGSTTAPSVALDVTGAALISSTLGVTGEISSATLTSGRVALVGTSGAIIDDSGITYDAAANSITATTFNGALSGNATTATTATTATNVTVTDEATDTSCFITFVTAATGDLPPKSNANMTFNSNTGVVTFASAILTTADINGGTIDAAAIGSTTASTGVFTTATVNTGLMPDANDGAYLGQSGTAFSDLFLAAGGVINWNAGAVTVTESSDALAFAGASAGYTFDNNLTVTGGLTNQSTSLNDDQAGYIEFTATAARGIISISGDVDAAGSALAAFRVGDNIFCRSLGSGISAGAVATTTGALTGTTGTDGNLTISVTLTATGNRLYIENRTGGARGYMLSFLGLVSGLPGTFTTV